MRKCFMNIQNFFFFFNFLTCASIYMFFYPFLLQFHYNRIPISVLLLKVLLKIRGFWINFYKEFHKILSSIVARAGLLINQKFCSKANYQICLELYVFLAQ